MDEQSFFREAERLRRRARDIRRAAAGIPEPDPDTMARTVEELAQTVEELQVAEEELRAQGESLSLSERTVLRERRRYEGLFQFAPDPYLVTDPFGTIQEANLAAVRRFSLDGVYLAGKPLVSFVVPEDRRHFRMLIASREGGSGPVEAEARFQGRQGEPFIGHITVSATGEDEGQPTRLLWMIRDVTDSKQMAEQLRSLNEELEVQVADQRADLDLATRAKDALLTQSRATEPRYRALFTSAVDAIFLTTLDGHIREANPAAAELTGASANQLTGSLLAELLPTRSIPERLDPGVVWRDELDLRRIDGQVVPVEASATAVELPDGSVMLIGLRDISERRALGRLQGEFLSMAAHELRTPLTSLKGFAQLFQRGMHAERAAQVIIEQVNHLDELVSDLLDVARLESGQVRLNRVTIDMNEVVARSIEAAQTLSDRHHIRLEALDHPALGWWDGHRLEQVMTNLLSNAMKYAPDADRVLVEIQESESEVFVAVTDYGPGIPIEAQPLLFRRFYRLNDPTSRGVEGMGLGLYISRLLVEAHGGQINLTSRPGAGSTFYFNLPRQAHPLTGPGVECANETGL